MTPLNVLSSRKEEAESRPKLEFIPKTLQDLSLAEICSSTEGLNGGRFAQPNSDFSRARNSKNSLYSSQQNLSQRPGSTGSNFSRSKFYGSQQNLQTPNKGTSTGSAVDQNRNPVNGYDTNVVDPWLNAWDSPNSIQPPPSAVPRRNNSSASSASQFRMPGPPLNNNNRYRSGGGGGGQSQLNAINNNFVHSNGSSSGSNGLGNGRHHLSSSTSTTTAQLRNQNTNNNNYSDPWSGDSSFYYFLLLKDHFMFPYLTHTLKWFVLGDTVIPCLLRSFWS